MFTFELTTCKPAVAFYSKLFGAEPTRLEGDYAKWMLDDPRINLAISTRGAGKPGVAHLGIQTDSPEEFDAMKQQAQAADLALLAVGEATCCYARSDKFWLTDPQGVAWEHFRTVGQMDSATCRVLCAPGDVGGRPTASASCCS